MSNAYKRLRNSSSTDKSDWELFTESKKSGVWNNLLKEWYEVNIRSSEVEDDEETKEDPDAVSLQKASLKNVILYDKIIEEFEKVFGAEALQKLIELDSESRQLDRVVGRTKELTEAMEAAISDFQTRFYLTGSNAYSADCWYKHGNNCDYREFLQRKVFDQGTTFKLKYYEELDLFGSTTVAGRQIEYVNLVKSSDDKFRISFSLGTEQVYSTDDQKVWKTLFHLLKVFTIEIPGFEHPKVTLLAYPATYIFPYPKKVKQYIHVQPEVNFSHADFYRQAPVGTERNIRLFKRNKDERKDDNNSAKTRYDEMLFNYEKFGYKFGHFFHDSRRLLKGLQGAVVDYEEVRYRNKNEEEGELSANEFFKKLFEIETREIVFDFPRYF